ncbi:gastrula zinc finger protein XlCGF26.1-like [Cyprinodon tularosa]|uniref:gastrula zinc finger protein XlCGF26.1-like n=1 Tax=Cyprinodon tularosa TaxID=77115 RepID=UPI0018E1F828|nr:gastrula zinc finger protein XlCGF26.1-like [Cyprinodon tularosa]
MYQSQQFKEFIKERLTAAAEEIFSEFEKTLIRYEETARLLDAYWKPHISLHKIDCPQHSICTEEEVSDEEPFCNQKSNFSEDQNEPELRQIKQEEFCRFQEEEEPKEWTNGSMLNTSFEKDLLQQQVYVEKGTTTELLEGDSSQDQEESEPQIKEELENLFGTLEEEQEESNSFMPTSSCEQLGNTDLRQYPGFLENSSVSYPETNDDLNQPRAYSDCQEEFYPGSRESDPEDCKNAELKPEVKQYKIGTDFTPVSEGGSNVDAPWKPFECGICGKTFQVKWKLTRHVETHAGKTLFSCGFCKKLFNQNSQLIHHMRIHTETLGQHSSFFSRSVDKPFVCGTCGKHFTKSYILKRHTRVHTGEKPFTCMICSRCFSRKDHMLAHMKIHLSEKGPGSSDVQTEFNPTAPLSKQPVIEGDRKTFYCEKCAKYFRGQRSFLCHMKSHRSGGAFVCKTCGQHFVNSSKLKRHEQVHTGMKPFSCSSCKKSFSRSDHMLRHMRICKYNKKKL